MPKKPTKKPRESKPVNQEINRRPNGTYAPGVSGNKNGRPRRVLPSEIMYAMAMADYDHPQIKQLQQQMPEPWRSKKNLTVVEIQQWLTHVGALKIAGEIARKEVRDRLEGKPAIRLEGPLGGPVQVQNIPINLKQLTDDELRRWRQGDMTIRELQEIMARVGVQMGEDEN